MFADAHCRAPDSGKFPPVNAFTRISNGIKIGGSAIGSPQEIEEMFKLAADRNIRPWVQEKPMKDANQILVDFADGKARYRYVLVNEKHVEKRGSLPAL
jgi:alcohol dehydrogenase (NADP+)